MKYIDIKKGLSVVLTLCAVLGWWGVLYPEFTLLRGTYRVVYEDVFASEGQNTTELDKSTEVEETKTDSRELYWDILGADRSHIRLKSRLLTDWNALQGAEEWKHESANQQ